MKHFDPAQGWVDAPAVADEEAGRRGESPPGTVFHGTVFHFSRRGTPLNVQAAAGERAVNAGPVKDRLVNDGPVNDGPAYARSVDEPAADGRAAELTAARDALVEVFDALDPRLETARAVSEVSDTLECLAELHAERERLEAELRRTHGQIEAAQRLLEASLIAAEAHERRMLDSQRLRAELMQELAHAVLRRNRGGAPR